MKNKADISRPAPDARVQVFILLILATILDFVTGPYISAAAFYIFPVALAGWRVSGRAATLLIVTAVALNAASESLQTHRLIPDPSIVINEALDVVVYIAVALLCTHIRHEQTFLTEKGGHIEQLNAQMAAEMQAARSLQELISTPPPDHPAIDIGTFSATARILGGDALDTSLSGDRLAVLIADVSGKGSYAALATAVLLGMLEDCPSRYTSPAQTLQRLNSRLGNRLPEGMFVTALYFILDLHAWQLTWASAGHEPPFLVHGAPERNGDAGEVTVEELTCRRDFDNTPLTVIENATYVDHEVTLRPNDVLFCYTDGLPDMRLPEGGRLGIERLGDLVAAAFPLPCDRLISAVLREASGLEREQFAGSDLEDDVTIIALRRQP